MQGEEIERT
jgi:hypothetical protein